MTAPVGRSLSLTDLPLPTISLTDFIVAHDHAAPALGALAQIHHSPLIGPSSHSAGRDRARHKRRYTLHLSVSELKRHKFCWLVVFLGEAAGFFVHRTALRMHG